MQHRIEIGDMLELERGLLVHGCNSHGVMGSGIALQVKHKYPECFDQYAKFIKNTPHNKKALGSVCFYEHNPQLVIASAITQESFGRDGKRYVSYKAIQTCFQHIATFASSSNFSCVHFPMIGAGLGGGEWSIIYPMITSYLDLAGLDSVLWILD